MKKTLMALMALAGIACGADSDTTVITFSTGDGTAGDYKYGVTWGDYSYNTHNKWQPAFKQEDGVSLSFTTSNANMYTSYTSYVNPSTPTSVWTNSIALTEMNQTLGTSLTLANLDSAPIAYAGGGGVKPVLTLNFSDAQNYGNSCIIYLLVGGTDNEVSSLTLGGLAEGYTMEYATATGSGFSNTASFSDDRLTTLVKITGTFADKTKTVTFQPDSAKSGFAMVAYTVPEPTTATLSLLALAGLAARRRRR